MRTEDINGLVEKLKEACAKKDAASLALVEASSQIELVERQLHELSSPNTILPNPKRLTNQEYKIHILLKNRLTNKEIANQINVTERTVKFHVSNILAKLALKSRIDLF